MPFSIGNAAKDLGYYRETASEAGVRHAIADAIGQTLESVVASGHGQDYMIVMLTMDNPTMAYGIDTIQGAAEVINRDLNPDADDLVPPASRGPSWGTPDEPAFCSNKIYGSMSTDHGVTWSTPEAISGTSAALCSLGNFFDPTDSPNACDLDQVGVGVPFTAADKGRVPFIALSSRSHEPLNDGVTVRHWSSGIRRSAGPMLS